MEILEIIIRIIIGSGILIVNAYLMKYMIDKYLKE